MWEEPRLSEPGSVLTAQLTPTDIYGVCFLNVVKG